MCSEPSTYEWAMSHEYSLFYRALLQKRPIIWRGLRIVATPWDTCAVNFPHMNEPCPMYVWGMSHIWISHLKNQEGWGQGTFYMWLRIVPYMCKSCPTYEYVISHVNGINTQWTFLIWLSHVPYINKSCHTYEYVIAHMNRTDAQCTFYIWLRHVPYAYESCPTYE